MKKMMGSELSEVGGELGVERKDVDAIKRVRFKRLLFKRIFGWIVPLLAFVVGFFAGGALPSSTSVYPYAAATFVFNYKAFSTKTKFAILGTAILSVVVFILGFVLGGDSLKDYPLVPKYTVSPEYGVFHVQGTVT